WRHRRNTRGPWRETMAAKAASSRCWRKRSSKRASERVPGLPDDSRRSRCRKTVARGAAMSPILDGMIGALTYNAEEGPLPHTVFAGGRREEENGRLWGSTRQPGASSLQWNRELGTRLGRETTTKEAESEELS